MVAPCFAYLISFMSEMLVMWCTSTTQRCQSTAAQSHGLGMSTCVHHWVPWLSCCVCTYTCSVNPSSVLDIVPGHIRVVKHFWNWQLGLFNKNAKQVPGMCIECPICHTDVVDHVFKQGSKCIECPISHSVVVDHVFKQASKSNAVIMQTKPFGTSTTQSQAHS